MEIDDKWMQEMSAELTEAIMESAEVTKSLMNIKERVAKMIVGERPIPVVSADGPPPAPHNFFDQEETEGCEVPGAVVMQGDYTGEDADAPEGG